MALTREQILALDDLDTETLDVPKWGKVRIRMLTGDERDKLDERFRPGSKTGGWEGLRAWLVSLCCVDEQGQPLFTPEDAKTLGKKSSRAISAIFNAAMKLNGLTKDDAENLAKNSETAPSGGSGSSSPAS